MNDTAPPNFFVVGGPEDHPTSVNDAVACREQDIDIADCVAMLVTGLTKPWAIKRQTRSAWLAQHTPPVLLEVGWLAWQLGALNTVPVDAGEYRLNAGRGNHYYVSVGTQRIVVPDKDQRDALCVLLRASHETFALRARRSLLPLIAVCPEGVLDQSEVVPGIACGQTAFFANNGEPLQPMLDLLNEKHKEIVAPAFNQLKAQLRKIATRV